MITHEGLLRMREQEYTITKEQVAALEALPPGIYLVCSRCGKLRADGNLCIQGDDMLCEFCEGWTR